MGRWLFGSAPVAAREMPLVAPRRRRRRAARTLGGGRSDAEGASRSVSDPSLAVLFKALRPLLTPVVKRARVVHSQRKAARQPSEVEVDFMEAPLRQTLTKLQAREVDHGFWRQALQSVKGAVESFELAWMNLEFLRVDGVQQWLQMADVQDGIIIIAKARISGARMKEEASLRDRLGECYAVATGESQDTAGDAIDTLVAVLAAGFSAAISPELKLVAGMVQAVGGDVSDMKETMEDVARLVGAAPIVSDLLSDTVANELNEILTIRAFAPDGGIQHIQELWHRVENGGELAGARDPAKSKVRYWTARLCAGDSETLEVAQAIRPRLTQAHAGEPLAVIDALMHASAGDFDSALQLVRDVDDSAARSVLFHLVARSKGEAGLLAHCRDLDPVASPTHFTDIGWRNWAIFMAGAGRWGEAARGLLAIAGHVERTPALAEIEGRINAALVLPAENRSVVLRDVPLYGGLEPSVDATAEVHRQHAATCFRDAEVHLQGVGDAKLMRKLAEWRTWLELMAPHADERHQAHVGIVERMNDGAAAVGLMPLVWSFGITFNEQALSAHLARSRSLGGLSDEQLLAQCLLNQRTMGARDLIQYLDDSMARLDRVMPEVSTTGMLFQALVLDGQTERARALLAEREHHLPLGTRAAMEAELDAELGVDPRSRLERLYREFGTLPHLRSLIAHLRTVDDRQALGELLPELFERVPTLVNARELVDFWSRRAADHPSVLSFMETHQQLVGPDVDMQSAKAWALFHAGQLREAQAINDLVAVRRNSVNDLRLDVNLALAGGDWDRLPAIVDRIRGDGWGELDAEALSMLSKIAAQPGQSPDRALELARLAADRANGNPSVLISAYSVYVDMGRDEDASPQWLTEALKNSTSDSGPIWQADVQDVVERWIPARRQHSEEVQGRLLAGELPMGAMAGALNLTLSHMLLSNRLDHLGQDRRGSVVLPVVSGVRRPVEVQQAWTVGMDITSIMVLGRLGLLEAALGAFGQVRVAPDILLSLFEERAAARFHQPMLVRRARELRTLLDRGWIKVAEALPLPPTGTSDEVGASLAALLEACRRDGGVAICVKPLRTPRSFLKELADTSPYQKVIFSPADLCEAALRQGRITADAHERAMGVLKTLGQVAGDDLPGTMLDGPVYVDSVALSYLQSAGVLATMVKEGVTLRVHADVEGETHGLLAAGQLGDELAERVQEVATALRRGIESGLVSLLPRTSGRRDEDWGRSPGMSSVAALLQADTHCDAHCVDDRFINQHPVISGASGRSVPVVCVLDVLRYLRDQGGLDDRGYWAARHRLREIGAAFVPLEADELTHWLTDASFDGQRMVEGVELRTIRQTINRIESIKMANQREANALSAELQLVFVETVRRLWLDDALATGFAAALSTWVWRHLAMATHLGSNGEDAETYAGRLRGTVMQRVLPCLLGPPVGSVERRSAYRDWLGHCVVDRLKPANADLIEAALARVYENVVSLEEHREAIGGLFLQCLPAWLRDVVSTKDPMFATECGFARVVSFAEGMRVREADLLERAKAVFDGSDRAEVAEFSGALLVLERSEEGEVLSLRWDDADGKPHAFKIPELTLLSLDGPARRGALEEIRGELGPTSAAFLAIQREVQSRRLSSEEVSLVLKERAKGTAPVHNRLALAFAHGDPPVPVT